jgi:hypothetical protein
MRKLHWQDEVSLVLGAWLAVSPVALGLVGVAAWVSVMLGIAVMLFAIEGLWIPSYLEEIGEIGMGVLLFVSPWLFDYASTVGGYSNMLTAIGVIVLAVWEMYTDREVITWWHEHGHHPAA